MPIYYLDTSALLKRYVNEAGSAWMQATFEDLDADFVVSQLTLVEAMAALARRAKGGAFRPGDAARVMQQLEVDFRHRFLVIEVNSQLIDKAVDLAKQRALRGYDALQLATALTIRSLVAPTEITFVAADAELNTAAALEGLPSINPATAWFNSPGLLPTESP
jgi:predicted nucleic acid-binding protein